MKKSFKKISYALLVMSILALTLVLSSCGWGVESAGSYITNIESWYEIDEETGEEVLVQNFTFFNGTESGPIKNHAPKRVLAISMVDVNFPVIAEKDTIPDLKIRVSYKKSNGDVVDEIVIVTNDMIEDGCVDFSLPGTYTLNITYRGVSITTPINVLDVKDVVLESDSFLNYVEGMSKPELKYTIVYTNDQTSVMTIDYDSIIKLGVKPDTVGSYDIKIRCGGKYFDKTVNVISNNGTVAYVNGELKTFGSFQELVSSGGNIKLTSNVDLGETPSLIIDKDTVLDLNGFTIVKNKTEWTPERVAAIYVNGNITVSIINGSIDLVNSGGYGIYVNSGAKLAVSNLNITNVVTTAINVKEGSLVINSGKFEFSKSSTDNRYLMNCIDRYYEAGTASIEILGGTFSNWNPADNAAELSAHTNFVKDGYQVTSSEVTGVTWYTVSAPVQP